MKDIIKAINKAIISNIIIAGIIGLIAYFVYNVIAWNFNLAPLNYWTCAGVILTLRAIFQPC
jgi:predicted Kef-type K+ transport protein